MEPSEADLNGEMALIAEGVIGRDAEDFMRTELAQVMVGIAEKEKQGAIDRLLRSDPSNVTQQIQIRAEIEQHEQFPAYLRSLYMRGRQAINELEARHAETQGDDIP